MYLCPVPGTTTLIVVAPVITWLFVRISPDEVSTMPVPAAAPFWYARFVSITTMPEPIGATVAAREREPGAHGNGHEPGDDEESDSNVEAAKTCHASLIPAVRKRFISAARFTANT